MDFCQKGGGSTPKSNSLRCDFLNSLIFFQKMNQDGLKNILYISNFNYDNKKRQEKLQTPHH